MSLVRQNHPVNEIHCFEDTALPASLESLGKGKWIQSMMRTSKFFPLSQVLKMNNLEDHKPGPGV
jgi:hypothetical protein